MQFAAMGQPHRRVAFLPLGPITLKSLKPKLYRDPPETLGEHLRKRRMVFGLLQEDVALRLRVNEWTYLGWEHDRRRPPVRFLPRIIEFLGYDPFPEAKRIEAKCRKLGLSQEGRRVFLASMRERSGRTSG